MSQYAYLCEVFREAHGLYGIKQQAVARMFIDTLAAIEWDNHSPDELEQAMNILFGGG